MGIRDEISNGSKDESVLERLSAGTDNRREFEWPGKSGERVVVRLLSAKEVASAKFANQREFKLAGIEIAVHNIGDYREQEVDHFLWRALLDMDGKQLFTSLDDFRGFCSREVIAVLAEEYNELSKDCDPGVDSLDESGLKALLELVKKKPDLIPSKVSSLRTAWRLLSILGDQPTN